MTVGLQEVLVLLLGQQIIQLAWLGELDLEQPAVFVARCIHQARSVLDCGVLLGHVAADRRVDLTGRLDGLEGAAFVGLAKTRTDVGQLSVDNIAEGFLSVI